MNKIVLIKRMLSRKSANICCGMISKRYFHKSVILNTEFENPIWRTLRILKEDFNFKKKMEDRERERLTGMPQDFPKHADILIVGGGAIGSSIAYWLKEKSSKDGFRTVVIEKDETYKNCTTALSIGALRSQFALTENIQMALYGAEFLREAKKKFVGAASQIDYQPFGYLVLANEENAEFLENTHRLQKELGSVNILLGKTRLQERFPWLDVSDIILGSFGLEKEGWFNAMSILSMMKNSAMQNGTQYIQGEVIDFGFRDVEDIYVDGELQGCYEGLNNVVIQLPNGEKKSIEFAYCIFAAGHETGNLSTLAKIGNGPGMLQISLPIEKKRRYLYSFDCKENPPSINTPVVMDPAGVYFRREGFGGTFVAGFSPLEEIEKEQKENLEVDFNTFDKYLSPVLSKRVPAFQNIQLTRTWSGLYDYNTYDQNGVLGPHPYYNNLYIATGFSGQGIQQAPAIGRAIAELILDGKFMTIDLTRLGFDRFLVDKPMYEIGPC